MDRACDPIEVLRMRFPSQTIRVVDEIRRRNSDLFVCDVDGHGTYVVKFGTELDAEAAMVTVSNTEGIQAVFDSIDTRVRTVATTACVEPVPALIMDYSQGTDLNTLLSTSVPSGSSTSPDPELERLVRDCGVTLGNLHQMLSVPEARGTYRTDPVFERVRTRFALPYSWIERSSVLAKPVRSIGDYATYNFRLAPSGELVILDITASSKQVTAHQDCGQFLSSLARCYYGLPFRHYRAYSRTYRRYRAAFLDGYLSTAAFGDHPSADLELVEWIAADLNTRYVAKLLRRRDAEQWRAVVSLGLLAPRSAVRMLLVRMRNLWRSGAGTK